MTREEFKKELEKRGPLFYDCYGVAIYFFVEDVNDSQRIIVQNYKIIWSDDGPYKYDEQRNDYIEAPSDLPYIDPDLQKQYKYFRFSDADKCINKLLENFDELTASGYNVLGCTYDKNWDYKWDTEFFNRFNKKL